MNLRCFLLAGEHSGDVHGAELMESLQAQSENGFDFAGLGGPQMRQAGGPALSDWIGEAAVVGLWEVLKKYGYFKHRFEETLEAIGDFAPDLVVLIDYPGFNLRLARALRKRGFDGRLVYYISPQVWAWNRGRIPVMASLLDFMICIFPFEKELYEQSGLPTVFAGHPLVDELAEAEAHQREDNLIGLFPGSREREVRKLFPVMLRAVALLREQHPGLRVVGAAANERLAETMRSLADLTKVDIDITTGEAHQLMQRAAAGAVASGTATLEAAWFGLPYCLLYRVAWPTFVVGKALVKVKYLGIVNILAGREIVRELIQGKANPQALADVLGRLLDHPEARQNLQADLREIVKQLGDSGTHHRAAAAIVELLEEEEEGDPTRP